MFFTGQYCLSVSLFTSAGEDNFIDQNVYQDKHKQDGDGIIDKDQKETTSGMEKFLAVIGFLHWWIIPKSKYKNGLRFILNTRYFSSMTFMARMIIYKIQFFPIL